MILITGFGLMMMALSLLMIISPHAFSKGIIRFSQLTYFHIFEMMSRLFFGVVFVYYSPLTLAPTINVVLLPPFYVLWAQKNIEHLRCGRRQSLDLHLDSLVYSL